MTDMKGSTPRAKLQRQCTACRQMKHKQELIRIVRTPDGGICCDPGGRMNGRGAYLCRSADCLKKAMKSGCLEKSLRVKIPQEMYDTLREEIAQ